MSYDLNLVKKGAQRLTSNHGVSRRYSSALCSNFSTFASYKQGRTRAVHRIQLLNRGQLPDKFASCALEYRLPGDFGLDPFGLTSYGPEKERLQISEVKHGRLAMLAFAYIVYQAIQNGGTFP